MITLETATKLKELGFPQDTLLHYENTDNGWAIILNDLNFPVEGSIAAPSFEEVWRQLPFHKAFVKLNKTMAIANNVAAIMECSFSLMLCSLNDSDYFVHGYTMCRVCNEIYTLVIASATPVTLAIM